MTIETPAETPAKTPAKLPVWKTARECYRLTFQHLGDLLRFSWPWLLLLIAVSGAIYWALYPAEVAAMAETGSGSNALWIASALISTAIGAAIAVPWHRLLLLGENQSLAGCLTFDARRRSYFIKAVATLALPIAPIVLAAFLIPEDTSAEASHLDFVRAAGFAMATIAAVMVINRLSLILPATALDDPNTGWQQAWRMTSRSTWRLFWLSLLVLAPIFVAVAVAFSLYPNEFLLLDSTTAPSRAAFAAANVVLELVSMLTGMLYVTFLSLAYRHFMSFPAPERAPDSNNATPPAP